MVRAKTRPVTVIMVDETTTSSERASSAVPWKARAARGEPSSTSTRDSTAPASRNTTTEMVGSTQRAPLTQSETTRRRACRFTRGPYPGGRVATNSS